MIKNRVEKMDTITYSHKEDQLVSNKNYKDQYYKDLETFTDEVLNVSQSFIGVLIEEFQLYIGQNNDEPHPYEEYAFELLMLGTLWRIYAGRACRLSENHRKLLTGLTSLQSKENSLKPVIGPMQGVLSAMFFTIQSKNLKNTSSYSLELSLENLDKLLKWLEATGEFNPELKQFKIWKEFFTSQEPQEIADYLRNILIFADWFIKSSKLVIKNYTSSVEKFLYYLKLMEYEISSRSFKKDFEFKATASGTGC